MADFDEREEELLTLSAIYPELSIDPDDPFAASLELNTTPAQPLLVRFIPSTSAASSTAFKTYSEVATSSAACIEHDVVLSYLPPLSLRVKLPKGYPADLPPEIQITSRHSWLPQSKLTELEKEVAALWEEYGRCQILFTYVDFLQQQAESGFNLDQEGCLVLPATLEEALVDFDSETREALFNASTYDCEICLEPKKGSSCYQLRKCKHVFCRQCLQDFYNNAISEGDVSSVKCLSPDCGKDGSTSAAKAKRSLKRTLQPRELLAMGIEEPMVRRYVEMKRKKKLEADKNTVYCPRTWCQGPAKSTKYPPIPADLSRYVTAESSSDDDGEDANTTSEPEKSSSRKNAKKVPPNPSDRLAVCEKCSFAFCKVCYMGWHGPFARCFPRDPSELSAEEKASYDYIRLNTSPCPYCHSPTQKTMGCNHMRCFQCNTHFCYLCCSWLDGDSPYQHFNKPGTQCYQRLWELEEGDEGQAPGDGRGFAGGRGWEQLAIEAAREAEAAERAAEAEAEERTQAARPRAAGHEQRAPGQQDIVVRMARVQFDNEPVPEPAQPGPQQGFRRLNHAFHHRPPAPGAARVVRQHERDQGRGVAGAGRPALNVEDRQQQEIQRFLDMAQRDEEEEWDSDELGDNDEGFVIR